MSVQPAANQILESISHTYDFPHLLFCGPPGSGKKTRVMAFLRQLFGVELNRLRTEYRTIEEGDKKIEVQVTSSEYHVEITPADVGNNDRRVISYFLKDVARSQVVGEIPIKVVVINEAHRLSRFAQQALRRTMEKYAKTCRIIMVADSLSQVIEPVRSRCLIVRCPRVPLPDVLSVIKEVAEKEDIGVDESMLNDIAMESSGNMRRGLNLLEMLSMQKKCGSIEKILPQWEVYTDELCKVLLEGQLSTETIKNIRTHLYELLVHCVPPTEIFRRITVHMLEHTDTRIADEVAHAAATYEARMQLGSKPIFHLEAFAARFVCIYNDFIAALDAD